MITSRSEFVRGVRLVMPVLPGTAAWGLVSGVAMAKTGLTVWQAFGMTLLMYAGSAQLACLPLIAASAPVGVMFLTTAVVNLRFVIYALALAPAFRPEPTWRKLFLGYISSDPGFALFVPRYAEDPTRPHARWLYLGITAGTWVTWQAMTLIGIVLASRVPTEWALELAGSLALLALAIPLITTVPTLVGVIAATGVALIGADWPLRLGIIGGASRVS